MSKAMFGVATALALSISSAWAGDERTDEKPARDTVASKQTDSKGQSKRVSESRASGSVIEAGSGSGAMTGSSEAKESFEERWLREREGYRDGGY